MLLPIPRKFTIIIKMWDIFSPLCQCLWQVANLGRCSCPCRSTWSIWQWIGIWYDCLIPLQVTTEGDAFQFVFHNSVDAVAYAIAAQQALLTARWPAELEKHYRTRSRLSNDPCSSEDAELGNTECKGNSQQTFLCISSLSLDLDWCWTLGLNSADKCRRWS